MLFEFEKKKRKTKFKWEKDSHKANLGTASDICKDEFFDMIIGLANWFSFNNSFYEDSFRI